MLDGDAADVFTGEERKRDAGDGGRETVGDVHVDGGNAVH